MTKNKQGECPYCKSVDIEYGCVDMFNGDYVNYPAHCNKCGKDFIEGYHLEFDGMFDQDGKEIK